MRILIIDDDVVSLKKLEKLLVSQGHEPLLARDGAEGWELWQRERPHFVITDWVMPGMDGPELCRRIRRSEAGAYTYIVIVTARNRLQDTVLGMSAGADDFITKPYANEELAMRVRAGGRILSHQSKDLIIFSLAKLAESRDYETGNHLERIRHFCRVLAEQLALTEGNPLGIDDQFVSNIFLTSPLHDIGKVGIPDHILLKPDRLDGREFEIMKEHCRIGFRTLDEALQRYPEAEYLRLSAEIALYHHEQYDGSGYPQGLQGGAIPVSARIVALADVYDALVSRRVYKHAYPHEIAHATLCEGRGTHFDPLIVDGFLACEEQFRAISRTFRDDGGGAACGSAGGEAPS